MEKQREDLDKLNRIIRQVDLYKAEIESQLKIARRTTLKAEEEMIQKEMEKKRQDYLIDNMMERLRRFQERRAMYEAHIFTQQKETKAIMDMIQEAVAEIEAVQFEKKQLIQQWKGSLNTLQRRDGFIRQIEQNIQ